MANTYEAIKELLECRDELESRIAKCISIEVDAFYKQFGVGIKNISVDMVDASSLDERNRYLLGRVQAKLALD